MSPLLTTALVKVWAFAPVALWFLTATVMPLLTPPAARTYLAPLPPFSKALRWNLNWCLFWAGVVFLAWVAARLGDRLMRRLADPTVSRAEELIKAGELDGAIGELRQAIDADGPSVARWNALADALMKQERWAEVLDVSFDIGDRCPFDIGNRRRKALSLCKLGLPEVGLSELNRADLTSSRRLAELCSYCQALIDLGLFDRAWDKLRAPRCSTAAGRSSGPRDHRFGNALTSAARAWRVTSLTISPTASTNCDSDCGESGAIAARCSAADQAERLVDRGQRGVDDHGGEGGVEQVEQGEGPVEVASRGLGRDAA